MKVLNWLNGKLDDLLDGPLGEWMDKHPAPPWWVAPLFIAGSIIANLISFLISAGALAR